MSKARRQTKIVDDLVTFLAAMMSQYSFWTDRANQLEQRGENPKQAREFAEAVKVLIHNFSELENQGS
jgi:hypothetical protein